VLACIIKFIRDKYVELYLDHLVTTSAQRSVPQEIM
jgi:hypothetical protein